MLNTHSTSHEVYLHKPRIWLRMYSSSTVKQPFRTVNTSVGKPRLFPHSLWGWKAYSLVYLRSTCSQLHTYSWRTREKRTRWLVQTLRVLPVLRTHTVTPVLPVLRTTHCHHRFCQYYVLHTVTTGFASITYYTLSPPVLPVLPTTHCHHRFCQYYILHTVTTGFASSAYYTLSPPVLPVVRTTHCRHQFCQYYVLHTVATSFASITYYTLSHQFCQYYVLHAVATSFASITY